MKKIISLFLALFMLVGLSSCGSKPDPELTDALLNAAGEAILAVLDEAEEPPAETPAPTVKPTPAPAASEAPAETPSPTPEAPAETPEPVAAEEPEEALLPEDGSYTHAEDVALYIHQYGHLPGNFISKKEAEKLGWSGGSLEKYAPGKCIGGSRFGNYEGALPEKKGRTYTECDIDTLGAKSRGAKRIVFSNDGLIYYTADHYETFTLLYGEE